MFLKKICLFLCILKIEASLNKVRISEIPFEFEISNSNYKDNNNNNLLRLRNIQQAKFKLEKQRNFLHLFNVNYLICFFAAKGKWPFIPPGMEIQVDQVGRSVFTRNDHFIRNYCHKWLPVEHCHRPVHYIVEQPPTVPPAPIKMTTTTEEPEPEETTTVCSCGQYRRSINPTPTDSPKEVYFFDKNQIGNVSSDILLNTIEFLQSFLPYSTTLPITERKKKKKTKIHIDVSPRLEGF